MTTATRPVAIPQWADTGDKTQPSDALIEAGVEPNVPVTLEHFNWIQNWITNGVQYLTRKGVAAWDANTTYLRGDVCTYNDAVWQMTGTSTALNKLPSDSSAYWFRRGVDVDMGTGKGTLYLGGGDYALKLQYLTVTVTDGDTVYPTWHTEFSSVVLAVIGSGNGVQEIVGCTADGLTGAAVKIDPGTHSTVVTVIGLGI